MSTVSYPTEKILELAYAAHRINMSYVKNSSINYEEPSALQVWANKELIGHTAAITLMPKDTLFPPWIPENFVPIEVTDADRDGVAKLHKFFRRYTMLILGDSLNEFQQDMYTAYSMEECGVKQLGYFAYMPSFIERESENIAYSRKIKVEYADSAHLQAKSFHGNVEIIKRIFLQEWDIYLYFAGTDGNLVSFSKKDKYEVEAVLNITAKIKSQDSERETGLPMTRMNYVKVF
jgi:hypothetical protein